MYKTPVLPFLALFTPFLILALGLAAASVVAQESAPPAAKAEGEPSAPRYKPPAGYYVAIDVPSFDAIKSAFRSTAIHDLLQDASVVSLIEKIEKRYQSKLEMLEEIRELARDLDVEETVEEHMEAVFKTLLNVRPERIRFYFYRSMVELKKQDWKKKRGDRVVGVVAGVVLRAEDVASVKKALDATESFLIEKEYLKKTKPRWVFENQVVSFFVPGEKKKRELGDLDHVWYFWADRELYFGVNSEFRLRSLAEGRDQVLEQAASKVTGGGGVAVGTVVVDIGQILEHAKNEAGEKQRKRTKSILEALGLAGLKRLVLGLSTEGLHWRQTMLLEMPDKPTGLLGALLAPAGSGRAASRGLPAPHPLLLEVKGHLDIANLVAAVKKIEALAKEDGDEKEGAEEELVEEEEVEEEESPPPIAVVQEKKEAAGEEKGEKDDALFGVKLKDVGAALDGGYTFTISAPTQSILPPRLALKVGVADPGKLETLIGRMKKKLSGVDFQEQTYRKVKITSIHIANSPVPLVPSFARVDDALYVGESPRTLKSIIRSLKSGGKDAEAVEPPGQDAPAAFPGDAKDIRVELRFDTGEIFRMMNENYLPMIQLLMERGMRMQSNVAVRQPLINFAELPDTETVIRHLGPGRGGVAWSPDGLTITAVSPLGEPFTAAAMTVYPSVAVWGYGVGLDTGAAELEKKVCHRRLRKIREALKLYRASFGGGKRYPSELGALLGRALVEDADVFRVPSDENPTMIEFENEDGEIEEIAVSYKYLPDSKLTVPAKDLRGWTLDYKAFGLGGLGGRTWEQQEPDKGVGSSKRDKTILLYEINRNRHGGRFLLCTDGSIYVLPEKTFKRVLALK